MAWDGTTKLVITAPSEVYIAGQFRKFGPGGSLAGDGTLFTREDAVEAAWAVVDPVLKTHYRASPYKRGSWGPKAADALIKADGGWHNPVLDVPGDKKRVR